MVLVVRLFYTLIAIEFNVRFFYWLVEFYSFINNGK